MYLNNAIKLGLESHETPGSPLAILVQNALLLGMIHMYGPEELASFSNRDQAAFQVNARTFFENNENKLFFRVQETQNVNDVCIICKSSDINDYEGLFRTNCNGINGANHLYHKYCLIQWFITRQAQRLNFKCPTCHNEFAIEDKRLTQLRLILNYLQLRVAKYKNYYEDGCNINSALRHEFDDVDFTLGRINNRRDCETIVRVSKLIIDKISKFESNEIVFEIGNNRFILHRFNKHLSIIDENNRIDIDLNQNGLGQIFETIKSNIIDLHSYKMVSNGFEGKKLNFLKKWGKEWNRDEAESINETNKGYLISLGVVILLAIVFYMN